MSSQKWELTVARCYHFLKILILSPQTLTLVLSHLSFSNSPSHSLSSFSLSLPLVGFCWSDLGGWVVDRGSNGVLGHWSGGHGSDGVVNKHLMLDLSIHKKFSRSNLSKNHTKLSKIYNNLITTILVFMRIKKVNLRFFLNQLIKLFLFLPIFQLCTINILNYHYWTTSV